MRPNHLEGRRFPTRGGPNLSAVFVVVGLMVLSACLVWSADSTAKPNAHLTPAQTLTYNNWIGWDGNQAIYPSADGLQTCLPPVSAKNSVSNFGYDILPVNNSVVVGSTIVTPTTSPGLNGQTCGPWYGWDNIQGEFILNVPLYTITGTNLTGVGQGAHPYATELYYVNAVDGQVAVTGLPPDAVTTIRAGYYEGLNSTPGNVPAMYGNDALLSAAIDTGITIATTVFPLLGIVLLPLGAENTWLMALGGWDSGSGVGETSNYYSAGSLASISVWAQATGGTFPGQSNCNWHWFYWGDYGACGENVFSESTEITTSFIDPANVVPGALTIAATNQNWENQFQVQNVPVSNGLTASVSFLVEPAVSIGGMVDQYPGGPPANDAQVFLSQTYASSGCPTSPEDFKVTTSSTGYWHFFANPFCSYSYYATGSSSYQGGALTSPTVSLPANVLVEGRNFSATTTPAVPILNLGTLVTFSETGLPGRVSWSVNYAGAQNSSTTPTIQFVVTDGGPYYYTVTGPAGYTASPANGWAGANGQTVPVSVKFTQVPGTYTVTFTETGLQSGLNWFVTVGSSQKQAAAGVNIVFTGLTGKNSYSIPSVIYVCNKLGCIYYVPSPSSGTFSGAMQISVTFTWTRT